MNSIILGIVQDSFKYLKSLTYLDLSSTNLVHVDSCLFIPLTSLTSFQIERVPMNCSSCWLSVAKKNSIQLSGQCINNNTIESLKSLTDQQILNSCSQSSIDCSIDYCEPGTFDFSKKSLSLSKLSISIDDTNASKNRTIEIVLGVVFSIIALLIILAIIVLIYRYKKGKNLICCDLFSSTKQQQQPNHQKQINDSVVTQDANLNILTYSQSNESPSNTRRQLYNPMFSNYST